MVAASLRSSATCTTSLARVLPPGSAARPPPATRCSSCTSAAAMSCQAIGQRVLVPPHGAQPTPSADAGGRRSPAAAAARGMLRPSHERRARRRRLAAPRVASLPVINEVAARRGRFARIGASARRRRDVHASDPAWVQLARQSLQWTRLRVERRAAARRRSSSVRAGRASRARTLSCARVKARRTPFAVVTNQSSYGRARSARFSVSCSARPAPSRKLRRAAAKHRPRGRAAPWRTAGADERAASPSSATARARRFPRRRRRERRARAHEYSAASLAQSSARTPPRARALGSRRAPAGARAPTSSGAQPTRSRRAGDDRDAEPAAAAILPARARARSGAHEGVPPREGLRTARRAAVPARSGRRGAARSRARAL